MDTRATPSSGMIAMAVGGVVALLLYGWFLSTYLATAYGDAVVGQAIEALTALGLLWLALLALMGIDRAMGGASWPRRAGFFVVPIAGIATFFATDYPGDKLCQWGIVAMPPLIGLYILAGRLEAGPASRAQLAILAPMAAFSAYSINLFAS